MNKFKTDYDGLMPLFLDDIRWMDASVRDAFYGLMTAFGVSPNESFKLSGCVVTVDGESYTTTAGYLVFQGEILKVDAHTAVRPFPAPGDTGWYIGSSYDASGNKVFKDGNSYDTYEIRKAVISHNLAPGYPHMELDAPYLTDKIKDITGFQAKIDLINSGWVYPAFNAEDYFSNLELGEFIVSSANNSYKKIGNTLIIDFLINGSLNNCGPVLYAKIPGGFHIASNNNSKSAIMFMSIPDTPPYDNYPIIAKSVIIEGNLSVIAFGRVDAESYPITADGVTIRGQIIIEIQ